MFKKKLIISLFFCLKFLNAIPLDYGVAEEANSKFRHSMEDVWVYQIKQDIHFFGVFDGHGGSNVAQSASRNLFRNIIEYLKSGLAPKVAIEDGFITTNLKLGSERLFCEGSCAIIALIRGNKLYIANLGDSRAVLCKKGQAKWLSKMDHKASDLKEQERIRALGGEIDKCNRDISRVGGCLAVTRSFGDFYLKNKEGEPLISCQPDVFEYHINDSYDFLILACDGVWDVLSNKNAVRVVKEALSTGISIQEAADCLVKEALKSGSTDNITAMVIDFGNQRHSSFFDTNNVITAINSIISNNLSCFYSLYDIYFCF